MQETFRNNAVKAFWQKFHPYSSSSAVERIKFCVSYGKPNYCLFKAFVCNFQFFFRFGVYLFLILLIQPGCIMLHMLNQDSRRKIDRLYLKLICAKQILRDMLRSEYIYYYLHPRLFEVLALS